MPTCLPILRPDLMLDLDRELGDVAIGEFKVVELESILLEVAVNPLVVEVEGETITRPYYKLQRLNPSSFSSPAMTSYSDGEC